MNTEDDASKRSARVTRAAPAVIWLRSLMRIPCRALLPLSRRNLAASDNGQGTDWSGEGDLTDHAATRSWGGEHRFRASSTAH